MTEPIASMERCLFHLRSDGYCVLTDVIPDDRVAAVRRGVLEAVAQHRSTDAPPGIGHVSTLINHDQSLAPYLADERLLALVRATLGPYPRISFITATVNEPGNPRLRWHADWPFNQSLAGAIPAPYPDAVMHLTTIWMLSPFTVRNGGTLLVPGSHRLPNNPTGGYGIDLLEPHPSESHATGSAGSVLVFDSRLWHASSPNRTSEPRVAVVVRYAPHWLNLAVLNPQSSERQYLLEASGKQENRVPALARAVFDRLPENVKPLFVHNVADGTALDNGKASGLDQTYLTTT